MTIYKKFENKQIFLYGAGGCGIWTDTTLKQNNITPVAFLDSNKKGNINGTPVYNPFTESIDTANALVIVSIFNRDCDYLNIKQLLKTRGFNAVIPFIEFYSHLNNSFSYPSAFWLSHNKAYLNDSNDILTLLKDNISRDVFSSIIKARQNNSYEMLPVPYPISEQYFSKDVPLHNYDTFIDCGAYNGDTIADMTANGITIRNYYGFEPDLKSFKSLSDAVKEYDMNIVLFPSGIHSHTEIIKFTSDNGEGSAINDNGSDIILGISLDETFPKGLQESILLKMDIEGAEMKALHGAENFIRNNCVDIAISVYHKPDDIIKIPKFINTFGCFDFYIRQYGYYGLETVLYAIRNDV
jgi:FkbM family methyltransferase